VTGLLKANPLGLYDMLGNADEFTIDLYRLNRVTRLAGRPGGYVIKGGNYLTSMNQIRSASRSEFEPYTDKGPRKTKTTGFRLVISAATLNDQDDIEEARAEWDRLGSLSVAQPDSVSIDDPVKEIQALTEMADAGSPLRQRLERLGSKVKADILELKDQKERSARTMLRLGAWLGAKMQADIQQVATLEQGLASGAFDKDVEVRLRDRLEEDRAIIVKNMAFYSDLVVRVADDFELSGLSDARDVLASELNAAGVSYLVQFADLFSTHIEAFAANHIVQRDDWLDDFKQMKVQ
jgi:hypothetical protein